MTKTDRVRAIYVDFECLKTKPSTPILLGILKDLRGEPHFEQIILDDTLKSAAVAARHVRHAGVHEAIETLVAEAEGNDCVLVGWSFFDRDVMLNAGIPELLKERVRRLYVNALETAKPWKTKIHPKVKIGRADKFAAKNTLDKFAALAGYPRVDKLLGGEPAKWIRDVQQALKRTPNYQRVKKAARQKWRALLDYSVESNVAAAVT
jgi:hypothetical protein